MPKQFDYRQLAKKCFHQPDYRSIKTLSRATHRTHALISHYADELLAMLLKEELL